MVLCISGFDPLGYSGLIADLETCQTFGADAFGLITCQTVQSRSSFDDVIATDLSLFESQLKTALAGDRAVDALKIGALGPDPALAELIHAALLNFRGPIVLDPVWRSTSGGALGLQESVAKLAPLATLITPNQVEAAALGWDSLSAIEHALQAKTLRALLLKGGHDLDPKQVCDQLFTPTSVRRYFRARLPKEARGTGCALASAIAAQLAQGEPLEEACTRATEWIHRAIAQSHEGLLARYLPPLNVPTR